MKLVADENIPFAEALFGSLGSLQLLPGREIAARDLNDTDILIVRSVTSVDQALLKQSPVSYVGSCTIGTDHLDTSYFKQKGIGYASAPGCNANAVVQYVLSALSALNVLESAIDSPDFSIAIVGCGNVGGRLFRTLLALGIRCRCVDPFLDASSTDPLILESLCSINDIYDCDVVCVHTPYTHYGDHPTHNLIDYSFLSQLKAGTILLNAGRGKVVSNIDLLRYLELHDDLCVVLDVWAEEPDINQALFSAVEFGTMHIAGYSLEGKINGALMIFDAVARFLGLDAKQADTIKERVEIEALGETEIISEPLRSKSLQDIILSIYDIRKDHLALQQELLSLPSAFDRLRKNYPVRRDFNHYGYRCSDNQNLNAQRLELQLSNLGFIDLSD